MRWGWIRSMFEASSTTQFPAGGGLLVRWSAGVTLDAISSLKPLVKVEALVLIKPLSPPTCGIWCALLTVRNNQAEIQYLTSEKDGEQDVWGRGRGSSPTMGSIERNVWARSYIIAAGGKMKKKKTKKQTHHSSINVSVQFVLVSKECWNEWFELFFVIIDVLLRPCDETWWDLQPVIHRPVGFIKNKIITRAFSSSWSGSGPWCEESRDPYVKDAPASQQASKPAFILLNVQKKWAEWDHSAL